MSYPLLNDLIAEELEQQIAAGVTVKDAAARAEIGERTLYRWLERGRAAVRVQHQGGTLDASEEPFADLFVRIDKARGHARARAVAVLTGILISETADDSLKAKVAMWWLERTDPAEWGRRWAPDVPDAADAEMDLDVELDRAAELMDLAREQLALPPGSNGDGDNT